MLNKTTVSIAIAASLFAIPAFAQSAGDKGTGAKEGSTTSQPSPSTSGSMASSPNSGMSGGSSSGSMMPHSGNSGGSTAPSKGGSGTPPQ